MISTRTIGTLCAVIFLLGSACSSSDGDVASEAERRGATSTGPTNPAPDATTPIGTFEVEEATTELVDSSRVTKAHGGRPELPNRTLPVHVWYPKLDAGKQVPLIVFSHGSTRLTVHYEATLEVWASAGYIVVGADFPLSKEGTAGGTNYGDVNEQARDVSFLIDRVLDSAGDPDLPWAALVDPEHIGLGGQSLGAITTLLAAADPCCADRRVDAVTEFAGAWSSPAGATTDGAAAPPALLVHGDADPTVPYGAAESLLDDYPGARQLLTLVGSGHDQGFFEGLGAPLDELVARATVAFYDQHLKDDPEGLQRLETLAAKAGARVATLSELRGHSS